MASIFTFDPDPPRVSSPWATPPTGTGTSSPALPPVGKRTSSRLGLDIVLASTQIPIIDNTTVTRLEAEPQEGPTEYKLHLLLKRRRSFTRFSTGLRASGSLRRGDGTSSIAVNRAVSESGPLGNTPPPLTSIQSRQHRLEQLTTQLLWRLQQSCPYHISSSTAPLLPHLPDDAKLTTPEMPQRLLPGLEESKGALYEIGVADDGSIVGLAEDEMEESLNNLRAMAASLGCRVEVQRMLCVGECEWVDYSTKERKVRTSKLLAAEALVSPDQHLVDTSKEAQKDAKDVPTNASANTAIPAIALNETQSGVEQLRVSLIGATMSGKSSLLGTLSTATLDNGRGKSRLSLLKHRHEIASGMTSSVTQELIGYRDVAEPGGEVSTQVISYGSGDVDAWVDIHAAVEAAQEGRLVVLSDSAGHPRFRRTTVRGIIGWQPHWTLVCVPADNTDESSGKIGASPSSQDILGPAAADLDLSQAHLELCLDLELPLVIVITKYDLATKAGLRQTLSKLLSALKEAGRKPCIISDQATSTLDVDIQQISASDLREAESTAKQLASSPLAIVPIVLTSAVKGTGITKLHAFLRQLPVPVEPPLPDQSPSHLFYIEDVYSVRANTSPDRSAIIGGYLRHGRLTVGEELLLGPYPIDTSSDDSDSGSGRPPRSSPLTTSRSYPGALHKRTATSRDRHVEWRRVRITSLRNLRLPVRALYAGQLGTVAVEPVHGQVPIVSPSINRIRKGMVLANRQPLASRLLTVRFEGAQARAAAAVVVGCAVVVYVASVRASSKVISVASETRPGLVGETDDDDDDDDAFGFGFDDEADDVHGGAAPAAVTVGFQFIGSREFIEQGAKVLVMPGGAPAGGTERAAKSATGLEGFVGHAVEQ
ncbi:hypothetical protein C7974DRAFT_389735 [Boeremia exigua]|uniref:uncharacterized protein n=1 Tax=Boeremia exigua TaxID=749465 RepID=UPI001E8D9658|nr:uncharacterized protein C7974DRAFT_389735 [Boeremia exigua]KAH6637557.1 hypothetical protein C7974DRAFT_389735 [Boeremia exigua]